MGKKKVLFVCIHNSARSQMAEELLRQLAGDRLEVESAGIDPGTINPLATQVLKEFGIDLSNKKTQSVQSLLTQNKQYDYVITVCDETSAERCPTFAGKHQRLHWGFEDPSRLEGDWEEKLGKTKNICKQIRNKIEDWLQTLVQNRRPHRKK